MIPLFPQFKKLDLQDKEAFEKITMHHDPYSDYNFVSIWSYNTNDSVQISTLHDNLIVTFPDYISTNLFYSFFGIHKIHETIQALLDFSKKNNQPPELKLIPEIVLQADKNLSDHFAIKEDIDNNDYILSLEGLAKLEGKDYAVKRNFINRFLRKYPHHTIAALNLSDIAIQKQILELFSIWEEKGGKTREDSQNELTAIQRLLNINNFEQLSALGIYYESKLIGFSIYELVQNKYVICHFEKADIFYEGLFPYQKHVAAKRFLEKGYLYLNYEQDLGLEGLRKAKLSYHPISYLRKYTITEK